MQTKRLNAIAAFLSSIFIFSISALAMNGRTTYQAKIIKPDGYPLEASSVNFRFTVLDTVGSCVLYVEDYIAVNMSQSGGLISFALGNGARSYPASGTSQTFQNTFDNSVTSFSCQTLGIYNPGPNDTRKIVMQFHDGHGWQTLPAMTINAVPYAMYANKSNDSKTLNGKADTAFVENSTLAALNCNPATHAITFNGVSFSCIPVGSSSSGITSVTTSGTVLSTGGTASAPVISITAATMSQDGYLTSLDYAEFKAKLSASSTQIINTLGYSPVSGAAVTTQISNSNLSGDVSGTISSNSVVSVGGKTAAQISTSVNDTLAATSSATADTLVKRNSSGNATFNDIYANAAKINYVDIYKPSTSFNIRLQAPTSLSTNYVLNLPTTSGTTGQVLSTDGAGNLSWINPSTGSVVSVSATAPLASTGGSNPTISITQATSSTGGYLSSTDWNTFNNKQAATSAAIIATIGFTPANDAASGTYLVKASNLSDLTNVIQARSNLGLGGFATISSLDLGSASATGTLDVARLPSFVGDATIAAASNTIVLSNSGVTAGTYSKVTVDAKGRVTSSSALSSSDITTALGYTPATSTTLAASFVQKTGDTMTGLLNLPSNGLVVGSNQLVVSQTNVGIGVLNPTAALHLKAGTLTNAPLKFTSGTLLSSAQSGTIEYDGSQLYFTDGSNARRAIATNSAAGSFDNTSSISNTSGNITLSPNNVTGSVIVNSSAASISSGTGALVVNGGVGIAGSINAGGNLNLTGSATIGQSLQLSSMTSGSLLFAGASGAVSENNSKLFWDGTNQRLGLGTNSPAQTLSVSGSSYFSGNVGIGTVSPNSKLHVNLGTNKNILFNTDTSGGTNESRISATNDAVSASVPLWLNGSYVGVQNNGAEVVRITGGNVGIGVAAPGASLDVFGAATGNGQGSQGTMIARVQDGLSRPAIAVYGNIDGTALADATASALTVREVQGTGRSITTAGSIAVGGAGGGAASYIIGNVGIGTTSPETKLHVASGVILLSNNYFIQGENTVGSNSNLIGRNNTDELVIGDPGYNNPTRIFSGNNYITLETSGSERLRVAATGNVGIGTASPSALLDLHGFTGGYSNARFNASSGGATYGFRLSGYGSNGRTVETGYIDYITTNGTTNSEDMDIAIGTSAAGAAPTEKMRVTSAGNVGIGTTAPDAKLHSVASTNGFGAHITGGNAAGIYPPANSGIYISENFSSGLAEIDLWNAFDPGTYAGTGIRFLQKTGASTATDLMFLKNNGNVGIGTTAPAKKLDIQVANAANVDDGLLVGRATGTSTAGFKLKSDGSGNYRGAITVKGNSLPELEVMSFGADLNNGNVGIGTASPQRKFHVSGGGIQMSNSTVGDGINDGFLIDYSSNDVIFSNRRTGGKLRFGTNGFSDKFVITDVGNVGIGTTSPSYKLDVSGTIRGFGITDSSDIRLKKDIEPLDFSLEKLLQVNGVTYYWKNPDMPKKQIGFIAQQLEKIYPELVETDNKGMKSVNYSHLIAPVIESIKTLYHRTVFTERRVASLENEVETLQKTNNGKEKQIQAMQKALCEMGRQEFCNEK